jgi:hypothetical protein
MSEKPDWFVRIVLVAILMVLAADVGIEARKLKTDLPVGRYIQFPMDDRKFVLLDTQTGNVYAYDLDKKSVVELNLVELAKKQKK